MTQHLLRVLARGLPMQRISLRQPTKSHSYSARPVPSTPRMASMESLPSVLSESTARRMCGKSGRVAGVVDLLRAAALIKLNLQDSCSTWAWLSTATRATPPMMFPKRAGTKNPKANSFQVTIPANAA